MHDILHIGNYKNFLKIRLGEDDPSYIIAPIFIKKRSYSKLSTFPILLLIIAKEDPMLEAEKQKARHTFAHHEPAHSFHKHSSTSNLFLFV